MPRLLTVLMAAPLLMPFHKIDAQESLEWSPELSMRYHAIQGTAMAPDGNLVAYVVRVPLMEGEQSEYRSQVWLASADGARNVQYTHGEHSATNPSFSPDGLSLAFTTNRSGENQIWTMRVAGGEAMQVTEAEAGVGAYAWSPDGTRFAYLMRDPETEDEELKKKEKRDVILVDQNFKYAHLYVVDVRAGSAGARDARRLTSGSFHVSSFDWSPDGRSIVFAHQPNPRINTSFISGDIAVVPSDSGAVTQLVTLGGQEAGPRYSPDGQWVAFTGTGDEPERIGLGDVYVVSALGGSPRKLADTPDRSFSLLGWSADGSNILGSEAVGVERHMFAVPVDGSAPRQLTSGEGVLGSVSFDTGATRIAFTFQTTDTPPDVFVSTVDSFAMTQISDVHSGVPRPPLGRTVVLNWTSNDGLAIEGLLTYPVNYEEGRRYPLVLNVHGGPAGVFSRSFTGGPSIYMIQTFAQRGYAVLRPNPRGSTGYGKDFRYANFRDWGYGDFDDLLAGVDHVIDMGVAHGDSLLLMGWSYGGYMTSFAVTRTDRFRAASMGAGLPNLVSMVTTTDIDDYLFGHMGAEFWDDYEVYERHSAIYRIKEVTTPTQVIHGAEDLRVPFTQGQEFYRALSRRGVPTEMIVYPRTPHGPREPKFLMDVTSRILTWFERYLRPARPATDEAMDDALDTR